MKKCHEEKEIIKMKKHSIFTKLIAIGCSLSLFGGVIASAVEEVNPESTPDIQEQTTFTESTTDTYTTYGLNDIIDIPSNAIHIDENKITSGSLTSQRRVQWYEIYFDHSALKEIALTGVQADENIGISIYRYMDEADQIERIGGSSSQIYHTLDTYVSKSCPYYIAVENIGGFNSGSSINYDLNISTYTLTDDYEPNNDLEHATAININAGSATKQYTGTIHGERKGQLDTDIYKLVAPHNGTVQISLSPYGEESAVNFQLNSCIAVIDSDGQPNVTWKFGNNKSYKISEDDTCYIMIDTPKGCYNEDIEYILTVRFEDDMDRWYKDADEILPVDLSNLTVPSVFPTGLLSLDKPCMIYKYDADYNGNIQIEMDVPNDADYIFRVYDVTNQKELTVNNNSIAFDVKKGNKYALLVDCIEEMFSKEEYRLVIGWDVYDDYEPNDTIIKATDISSHMNTADTYSFEATAHKGDKDYYKLTPSKNSIFNIKFEQTGSYDAFVSVQNSQGQTIANKNGNNIQTTQFEGIAGTPYYIVVSTTGVKTIPYTLTVSKTNTVTPDNSRILENDFENNDTSKWVETYGTTGRGTKTTEQEAGTNNHYMKLSPTGTSYYNFNCLHQDTDGNITFKTDIKFTESNMEIQMRDVTNEHSSDGYTMGTRLRKNAYYIEYFSRGQAVKLLNPQGEWLQLKDVSKWYTLEIKQNSKKYKQSIYLYERDTGDLVGKIENTAGNNTIKKINYIAISSTDTLCIDNVKIKQNSEDPINISKELSEQTNTILTGYIEDTIDDFWYTSNYKGAAYFADNVFIKLENMDPNQNYSYALYDESFNPILPDSDGRYFIKTQQYYIRVYKEPLQQPTDFALKVSIDFLDKYEPNDTIDKAAEVKPSSWIFSAISDENDKDYYKIQSPKDGTIEIKLSIPKNNQTKTLEVYDEQGNIYNTATPEYYNTVRIRKEVAKDEIIYFCVSGSPGAYDAEGFIINDRKENATSFGTIGLSSSISYREEFISDTDINYYKVTAADNGIMLLSAAWLRSTDNMTIEVHDEAGNVYTKQSKGQKEVEIAVYAQKGDVFYLCAHGATSGPSLYATGARMSLWL